jgi:hypothetical protein
MLFLTAGFAPVFPEKRLELKGLKNGILRVSLGKKKGAHAGSRVKTTFSRIIIIASNYDAEKSGFHAGSRACVLFFFKGYSQNPIFKAL